MQVEPSQSRGQEEFMHHTLSKEKYESDTSMNSISNMDPTQ